MAADVVGCVSGDNGRYEIEDNGVLKIVPDDSQPKILSPAYWREIIEGEQPKVQVAFR